MNLFYEEPPAPAEEESFAKGIAQPKDEKSD